MRVSRVTLLVLTLLVVVKVGAAEDVELGVVDEEARTDNGDLRKDAKTSNVTGGGRRTTTQASANTTRDSQLLSLLAARRRQLLHGRLATHINTLASLANKNSKHNTTFAQLELRDSNSSTVKRITLDSASNEPTLKLITTDGNKEIRQEIKPHEIRHLFVPKLHHDTRTRAGFMNNRRKLSNVSQEVTEKVVYIPPDKLDGLEKEIELDPEEEFQVDESNHGLYLLNYSDTENVTLTQEFNKTLIANETKEENTTVADITTTTAKIETETEAINKTESVNLNIVSNTTDDKIKLQKANNEKVNNTLFMTDEIYNHFRPLETELPVEDMAPFIYFGQKLGGQGIADNLTNLPTLSASTKTVNFIIAPPERKKFNSRYSATEKYKNSSDDEEEINEDMDVSVVKNIIEKNKVRNTVKGLAPARHVGLVNAYRKYTTVTTLKPPSIGQMNVTDQMISVTPGTVDKKDITRNNVTTTSKDKINATLDASDNTTVNSTLSKNNLAKVNTTSTTPRNYTRNYLNLRRRPAKVTASSSTESIAPTPGSNATTEKASTLVYTAVVTSVSITSSVKGLNKTDVGNTTTNGTNEDLEVNDKITLTTLFNETEPLTSTEKPSKHRIRIRTTTTESSLGITPSTPLVYMHKATEAPVVSELSTRNAADIKAEANSKLSDRLATLYGRPEVSNTTSTMKPKNILKRRRPTTTSTTTPAPTSQFTKSSSTLASKPTTAPTTIQTTEYIPPTTETQTFKPFVIVSRTSSESSSKPLFVPTSQNNENSTQLNTTVPVEREGSTEEVVIEAEKTFTASYVLAGLGFLPVAAIVAFVLRSILNKKTKEIDTEYEGYFDDPDIKKESSIIPVARPPIPTPSKPDKKWEFPRNKLRLQTLLGQGNFGQVWKAEADDLTGHDGLTRLVAVKSIKESASQKEKQELLHEIYIMQKIGTHPNVVTLLACCTEQEPYLLIMEYVMCGKLLTYLRERRSRPDRFSGSGTLTSRDLTVFAYCVARGMDYIASKGIVHRDLAARNVLVDHNKLCKIADFGMSRETTGGEEKAKQRHALPVRWMAPEALLYNAYNHETDVWAYGILLWEIVTLGSTPYAAMSGREVLSAVTEGYRLERPPHCKPQLYRAMHSCWHADPSQRPSFASLKSQLAELLDNEPAEGNYVDLDSFYQESSVYSDPSAIIHDEDGLSAEYDRERRVFRELTKGPAKYDNRAFSFRDEDLRNKFGNGTPRMGGFGIKNVPFNGEFNERQFTDKGFSERNFGDSNFTERKDGKLSTSSFHRERERENALVSRNSFNGFLRLGRDSHFQLMPEGRNNRVPEFECDI